MSHQLHFRLQTCLGLSWMALALVCLIYGSNAALGQDEKTPPGGNKPAASILDPTNRVGSWIWDAKAYDRQTCRLWKSFVIPKSTVTKAALRITGDNGYRLFLDGREIGRGSDWRTLSEYDITWLLNPGLHILAVEGFNDRLEAGVVCGMRIELLDQRVLEIASDASWRIVPGTEPNWTTRKTPSEAWPAATVVGILGTHPWENWPYATVPLPPLHPVITRFWQSGWFQITLLSLCSAAILFCLHLMTRLSAQSHAQRCLQLERARIARDIHDDLGARLTEIVLLGEVAQSELSAPSPTRRQIDTMCEKARELSHVMDELVWAVNSRRDTVRDFASYVCKYAQLFLNSRLRSRLDVEPDLPAMPFELSIRRNLFLAVKEALNNAAKHSGASEVFLRIHRQGDGLQVIVEDNGAGFDTTVATGDRNGLLNMTQRMDEVRGRFRLVSSPGTGCRVEFEVPLTYSRSSKWWLRLLPGKLSISNSHPLAKPPLALSATPAQTEEPVLSRLMDSKKT